MAQLATCEFAIAQEVQLESNPTDAIHTKLLTFLVRMEWEDACLRLPACQAGLV